MCSESITGGRRALSASLWTVVLALALTILGPCVVRAEVYRFCSIPAKKASKNSEIEPRLGIRNNSGSTKSYDVTFYLDSIMPANKLHNGVIQVNNVANGNWGLARCHWVPAGMRNRRFSRGNHNLLYRVKDRATGQVIKTNKSNPWPIKIINSLSGCTSPSTSTIAYIEPGVLMTHHWTTGDIPEAQLRNLVDQMHYLEKDTIVFSYAEAKGFSFGPFYPTQISSLLPMYMSYDAVKVVLDQAAINGMKVIMGIGRGPFPLAFAEDPMGQDKTDRLNFEEQVAAELWSLYGEGGSLGDYSDSSFYGWLCCYETIDYTPAKDFYDQTALRLDKFGPQMPLMISPVWDSDVTSALLNTSQADIFAYQDGLGYGFSTYANLDSDWAEYYNVHSGTHKHLWTNMELWRDDYYDGLPPVVAPWDEGWPNCGIAWQIGFEKYYCSQIMMNEYLSCFKSGWAGTPTNVQYEGADALWNSYTLYWNDYKNL